MTVTLEKEETKKALVVSPFGIEACNAQLCDLLIQGIPGCRLRSKCGPTTTTVNGQVRTPTTHGHSPPEVPGMQLHINPAELTYAIVDPLNEDEDAKARIKRYLHLTTGARQDANLKGAPTVKGKLDKNQMKTLCREIVWLIEAKDVRVVKGAPPEMEDVDEMPGKYLLNPGLRTKTSQPQFEEDLEEWESQLNRSGG